MTRKMGPKSAFDGLAASLRSQAAARLIPFGLTNQFKMAAKGFAHRMIPGVAWAAWMKSSLILFTAGLWCLPLRGDTSTTNTYKFEDSLPTPGSIQWDLNLRIAKERQELYRNPRLWAREGAYMSAAHNHWNSSAARKARGAILAS